MSQTNAKTKRPTQRSEMSKMQWPWKEMKKNEMYAAKSKPLKKREGCA